jgi:hypothetical protein
MLHSSTQMQGKKTYYAKIIFLYVCTSFIKNIEKVKNCKLSELLGNKKI